jgi:hypothetical protein
MDRYEQYPPAFDKERMWRAVELMNLSSNSTVAKNMRVLMQAYRQARESSMSDLEPTRHVSLQNLGDVNNMTLAEKATALLISHLV